jgi:bifunctional non-homologous end joining protein LigD
MLARGGKIPVGDGWSFEPKLDGFRAIVSTIGGVSIRSRRGWDMTPLLPEAKRLPADLLLDAELVALRPDGRPDYPLLSHRVLHGDTTIVTRLMVFDVLGVIGVSTMPQPYRERRVILESLELGDWVETVPAFDDGEALFETVQDFGLEGIVAKRLRDPYRPGVRGWIKVKNRAYWRYPEEVEAVRRSISRKTGAAVL